MTYFTENTVHGTRERLLFSPPDVELDGEIPFDQGWGISVPQSPGIYFLHDLRGLLYVGKTINLNSRFQQHFWRCHNHRLVLAISQPVGTLRFAWCIADETEQVGMEKEFIRQLQPLCNEIMYSN